MTTHCRSDIIQLLELAIINLENMYYEVLGEEYKEDLAAMMALDHLTEIKNAINPPFLKRDNEGNLVVSDMLTDHSEDLDSMQRIVAVLMAKVIALEKEIYDDNEQEH